MDRQADIPTELLHALQLADLTALEAECPICRALAFEPCHGRRGILHSGRRLQRLAELDAVRPLQGVANSATVCACS